MVSYVIDRLKLDSNKKMRWVGKIALVGHQYRTAAIKGYICILNMSFLCKNLFPFPFATAELISDVLTNSKGLPLLQGQ